MPTRKIDLFRRKLDVEQEPSKHQRTFLYLPLETLRDFTNIRSIIVEHNRKSDGKSMKNIEIQQKIRKVHSQMGMLNEWNVLHLDKLEFVSPSESELKLDYSDASIWSDPKIRSEDQRNQIHQNLSDHQKQFIYLPYHILKRATNIVKLVRREYKRKEKYDDYLIGQIFGQMAYQYANWLPMLANLQFVEIVGGDPILDDVDTKKNVTDKATGTSRAPNAPTATSKRKKNVSKSIMPQRPSRESQNPQSDSISDTKESANKKAGKNSAKGESTRELRKRKNDVNLYEDESPTKRAKIPAESTPKRTTTVKVPEIIRVSKKVPVDRLTKTSENLTRKTRQEMSDLNRAEEEPSTVEGNHSGRQPSAIVQNKSKVVQRTLPWLMRKQQSNSKPSTPKTSTPKTSSPKTSSPTTSIPTTPTPTTSIPTTTPQKRDSNDLNTNVSVRRAIEYDDDDDANCSAYSPWPIVSVLPVPPNINTNSVNNQIPADDYDHSEDELNQLSEQRDLNRIDQMMRSKACSPSDFQREMLELNFEDFISRTNIRELVLKEYRKLKNDESAVLSSSDMHERLEFYYDYRKRTEEWHLNCIKNLKLTNYESAPIAVDHPNHADDLGSNDACNDQVTEKSKTHRPREISEFQREIMALTYEEFVNRTNVKEIVAEMFQKQTNGTVEMTEDQMTAALAHFESLRNNPFKWTKTELIHLKFNVCECKRKKSFEEKSIETDVIETREIEVQCDPVDFNTNCKPAQLQQLADLAVHHVDESEMICISNVSSEPSQSNSEKETNAENPEDDVDSRPIGSQNTTKMPSQSTPHSDGESHHSLSQSVVPSHADVSDIFAMVPSQPILSLAEVRMSEFIDGSAPVHHADSVIVNPLETETVFQSMPVTALNDVETIMSTQVNNQFEHQQNSTPISSPNTALQSQNKSEIPSDSGMITSNIKTEVRVELTYHLGDDSDIICLGDKSQEIFEVSSDDLSTEELFLQCDNIHVSAGDSSPFRENLITVQTQPTPPKEEIDVIASKNELIRILSDDSPVIEDDESPRIQPPAEAQPLTKRPPTPKKRPNSSRAPRPKTNSNNKNKKTAHNESLSSIPVPKYNYGPLQFIAVGQNPNHAHIENAASASHGQRSDPRQIDNSQQSPKNMTNYSIEDSTSADEPNVLPCHDGMITDSCAERANLLNLDNTLFFDINTQSQSHSAGSPSTQIIHSSSQSITTSNTITTNQNENANKSQPTVSVSGHPVPLTLSRLNDDRTEFLPYVDIIAIQSSLKSVISAMGERVSCLAIETILQHQCNGNNRIIVEGDALKLIVNLTDREWAAAKAILTTIETFRFDGRSTEPVEGSLLHRAMYYLFRTASKISNVHIAYGDCDFETARVFYEPMDSTENITSTISPFVLAAMKAKARELNKIKHH